MARELWIGLVSVVPTKDCDVLEGAVGAYVNVLALASDASEYADLVEKALAKLHIIVDEIEVVEPFAERRSCGNPDPAVVDMAMSISGSEPVQFGTFHSFDTLGEA